MTARVIYKLVDRRAWQQAEAAGQFTGAPVDARDGYIHCSTSAQVAETARRHFAGDEHLLLVAVDADALGDTLRWEPSRGGALFPHIYGPLSMGAVLWTRPLSTNPDGTHVFPELPDDVR